jgi:nascent polypeptide-associated complex subunit beta
MADSVNTDEARQRMIAKRFGGRDNVRTGGKGTVRRKKKAVHKTATSGISQIVSALLSLSTAVLCVSDR